LPIQKTGNPRFARYAWGVLTYNILVVLWGALVRATGSGAGCGNHWPLCNGEVVPQFAAAHTAIEFTHRLMTGVDGPMIVLLVVWAFRAFPRLHPARRGAVLSGVFLVTESLLGAGLVLLEKVGRNASVWWQTMHLLNTLTLLASLTLAAWWGSGHPRVRLTGRYRWMAAVSLAAVMLMGVTGVIAALGNTLFPAHSVAEGLAQDLDPQSHIFLRLRVFHPMLATLVGAWLLFFVVTAPPPTRHLGRGVILLFLLQAGLGVANWLLLAPVPLQLVHLLTADLLWVTLVLLCATVGERPFEKVGHA
jgi:heme A synthase